MRSSISCLAAAAAAAVAIVASPVRAKMPDSEIAKYVPLLRGEEMQKLVKTSDEMHMVLVMAPPAQCNEVCDKVLEVAAKVSMRSQGLFKMHQVYYNEIIEDGEGESKAVGVVFGMQNETTGELAVPGLVISPHGPPSQSSLVQLPAQAVGGVFYKGPKELYALAAQFFPHTYESLSTRKLDDFAQSSQRLVVLVQDKPSASLPARKLSIDFASRASFGIVNARHEAVRERFGSIMEEVDVPALLVSTRSSEGPKVMPDGTKQVDLSSLGWQSFEGEKKYHNMRDWLHDSLPPQPLALLKSRGHLSERCSNGVCFVAVLSASPESQREQLQAVRLLQSKPYYKVESSALMRGSPQVTQLPLSFAWVPARGQPSFLETFEASSTPTLVAISGKKKKFAVHRGAFSVEDMHGFVLSVMEGKAALEDFDALPDIKTPQVAVDEDEADGSKAAGAAGDAPAGGMPRKLPKGAKKGKRKVKRKIKKRKVKKGSKSKGKAEKGKEEL